VLYVPEMNCNLINIGQLVEKGFLVTMDGDSMKLFDAKDITYKCNISSDNMMCML
jgi:hypothetical protein